MIFYDQLLSPRVFSRPSQQDRYLRSHFTDEETGSDTPRSLSGAPQLADAGQALDSGSQAHSSRFPACLWLLPLLPPHWLLQPSSHQRDRAWGARGSASAGVPGAGSERAVQPPGRRQGRGGADPGPELRRIRPAARGRDERGRGARGAALGRRRGRIPLPGRVRARPGRPGNRHRKRGRPLLPPRARRGPGSPPCVTRASCAGRGVTWARADVIAGGLSPGRRAGEARGRRAGASCRCGAGRALSPRLPAPACAPEETGGGGGGAEAFPAPPRPPCAAVLLRAVRSPEWVPAP
ncbi:tRNA (guanine-N(7)-)-methyltransferase-like [Vulpes lagopus]|uniref:tRNA (guanine-N(7)-)-methyltransferase-like n=1 Tax=Vulpes lagopus TaxID=494514 RepID=UPI001BC9A67C|nr:tRNA (guanine-N(7)-)-methyltransferase-like [Vulpes lagopus]